MRHLRLIRQLRHLPLTVADFAAFQVERPHCFSLMPSPHVSHPRKYGLVLRKPLFTKAKRDMFDAERPVPCGRRASPFPPVTDPLQHPGMHVLFLSRLFKRGDLLEQRGTDLHAPSL